MLTSNLSFEEYSAWCRSRRPPIDPGEGPVSTADTLMANSSDEACPVTVRSSTGDYVIVTPRPRGSR